MRKSKVAGVALMIGGSALALAGLVARRNAKPGFYAQAFPTANGQRVEAENKDLRDALTKGGLHVRRDWPSRYTFGRGGGPGLGPEIVEPVLIGVAFVVGSYTQGFIGQIGAEHSIAIRQTVKQWLERRKTDDFYLCIEAAAGQQVRALCPNGAAFTEAYDALDDALRQLPKLPPNGFCLIEWDDKKHRWVQQL